MGLEMGDRRERIDLSLRRRRVWLRRRYGRNRTLVPRLIRIRHRRARRVMISHSKIRTRRVSSRESIKTVIDARRGLCMRRVGHLNIKNMRFVVQQVLSRNRVLYVRSEIAMVRPRGARDWCPVHLRPSSSTRRLSLECRTARPRRATGSAAPGSWPSCSARRLLVRGSSRSC